MQYFPYFLPSNHGCFRAQAWNPTHTGNDSSKGSKNTSYNTLALSSSLFHASSRCFSSTLTSSLSSVLSFSRMSMRSLRRVEDAVHLVSRLLISSWRSDNCRHWAMPQKYFRTNAQPNLNVDNVPVLIALYMFKFIVF